MTDHKPIIHEDRSNSSAFTPEERARQEIDDALESARKRWDELQKAFGGNAAAVSVADDTKAENVTTVIAQLQALLKRIDQQHDDVKEPYLLAGRTVDGVTNALKDHVARARDALQRTLTAFHAAKQARIDAERAAIRAREEQDPEPGWTPPTTRGRTRIRSVEGATAHLTTKVDCVIEDVTKIPERYLKRDRVMAAIKAEVLHDIRRGDEIPGVRKVSGLESRVKA